jgi:5,10-methenyltetrahydrofolate synthetase
MPQKHSQFLETLSSHESAIGYFPLKNEPDPISCILSMLPVVRFNISPEQSTDPLQMAGQINKLFANTDICLYIPGTAFDVNGVRHGRGGGWYDRFLSVVSPQWMRIGFCFESQFSSSPLKREIWDEPVDWVCVKKADTVEYYQTKARFT